jgi:hypothetical protein
MNTRRTNALTTLESLTKRRSLKAAVRLLAALLAMPLPTPAQTGFKSAPLSFTPILITPVHLKDDDPGYASGIKPAYHHPEIDLPDVDPDRDAIFLIKIRGIGHAKNIFTFNGMPLRVVPVLASGEDSYFTAHCFIYRSYLKEKGNVLRIYLRNSRGGVTGELDDFHVDQMGIIYSTKK